MKNSEIAEIIYHLADQLEREGENHYRIRAYRRAARVILNLNEDIQSLVDRGFDLTQFPAIGKGIAHQLNQIVKTGRPEIYRKQTIRNPYSLELRQIKGLGRKRLKILNDKLKITNKKELIKAMKAGKLRNMKGFGISVENKIKAGLKNPKPYERQMKIYHAIPVISKLLAELKSYKDVAFVECGSSFRRKAEVVGNQDILVVAKNSESVIKNFLHLDDIREILDEAKDHASVILRSGLRINVYVVPRSFFGAFLLQATGSNTHLLRLQKLATLKKLSLTKKGIFRFKKKLASESEKEIYNELGLPYIPPELREDRGEIEAAEQNKLPVLIQLSDIKGDLHTHTNETDGVQPLEEMVNAAKEMGYEYIAITDHSKRLAITNGLDEKRLLKQIKLIDKLNSKLDGILILKSIEVDILLDGTLDLSDDILKELDIRVCSIHSRFRIAKEIQTERIIRAMDNPYFNILGHATGRLINSRSPYEIDMDRILQAAKDRNCFMELNGQPAPLDIHDRYCQQAKKMGVKIAISSDAHSTRELRFMSFGVDQARRGWLEPRDVINTRSWKELKKLIKRN